jgi:hypothetical protein
MQNEEKLSLKRHLDSWSELMESGQQALEKTTKRKKEIFSTMGDNWGCLEALQQQQKIKVNERISKLKQDIQCAEEEGRKQKEKITQRKQELQLAEEEEVKTKAKLKELTQELQREEELCKFYEGPSLRSIISQNIDDTLSMVDFYKESAAETRKLSNAISETS